jgi:hypothetical protein
MDHLIGLRLLIVGLVGFGLTAYGEAQAVRGTGTPGQIPLWTGARLQDDSLMSQSGGGITVLGPLSATEYRIGVARVLRIGGPFDGITAVGSDALSFNTSGSDNTAVGDRALHHNTEGQSNTAVGREALFSNVGVPPLLFDTRGSRNTAVGDQALYSNVDGGQNTALGFWTLRSNTGGFENVAIGEAALFSNDDGSGNTAVGQTALFWLTSGFGNIGIGRLAGRNLENGDTNIYIGSDGGESSESGTIRIGDSHGATFIAGIYGATTGGAGALVYVDGNGQLGTVSSSRRVKDEIEEMGEASRGLFKLRPVSFRYKVPRADGSHPLQYGLVAEEVAEVYPDLVARDPKTGEPWTVRYDVLPALLLNELQKQQGRIEAQAAELAALRARLLTLEGALAAQASPHR